MQRGRALLVGALAFLASFLALAVMVTDHRFDGADRLTRAFLHQPGPPLLGSSMEAASFLGGEPGQVTVVLLGAAVLWRRRRRWALSLPLIMAGAGLIQLAAKWTVDRPRPNLDPWGFPSAHVFSLVVLLGCLAYLVGSSSMRGRWRGLGVSFCLTAVVTVAYSRMYLDAHWLSDVLGGLTMGLAYLLLAIWLVGWIASRGTAPAVVAAIVDGATDGAVLAAAAVIASPLDAARAATAVVAAPVIAGLEAIRPDSA